MKMNTLQKKKKHCSLYIDFTNDSLPNYLLTTTNSPKEVVTNFSNQLNNFIFLLNTRQSSTKTIIVNLLEEIGD